MWSPFALGLWTHASVKESGLSPGQFPDADCLHHRARHQYPALSFTKDDAHGQIEHGQQ